jgi:hypothetical protein
MAALNNVPRKHNKRSTPRSSSSGPARPVREQEVIVGIRPEEIHDSALVPESRRTACSTEQSSCVRLSGRS